jgi:hypothetical protein
MSESKEKIIVTPSSPIRIGPTEPIRIVPSISPPIVVKPSQTIVVEPAQRETVRVAPAPTVTIKPPDRGAWDERGWTRRSEGGTETFEGFYQVNHRKRGQLLRFRGRIQVSGRTGQKISVYILNPPPEVKSHRHGPCFQLLRDGWFSLHWSRPARNVDDAILYLEKVLDESLN